MSPKGWSTETVEACLERVAVPSAAKLQTKDYRGTGKYPVIDQSQTFIAGWTDNDVGLVNIPLPLIVFGDHTRVFKFIDFPFVRGADGTQLLKPRSGIDPLYFYYACRAIDLPSRGYNRHFTILKEKEIALPPGAEQEQVARVLRRIEAALALQNQQVAVTENLKRAAMRELFMRGLRGEPQKETEIGPVPESWDIVPFSEAYAIAQGQVDPKIEPYASMLHIGPENVEQNTGRLLLCAPAKELGLISGKYLFHKTDIVYSKIRPNLRKVVLPNFTGICSADMYPLRPQPGFTRYFLFAYLLSDTFTSHAVSHDIRTGIPKINREQLNSIRIPKPCTEEQEEIAKIIEAVDRKIELHGKKRAVLDELSKALLHKLMTGEIRVADLDLSALAPARVAEAAQ